MFTITIGPPGAGKSTWADTLPNTTLRLERDRFREAIFGSRRAYHEHQFPLLTKSKIIGAAMFEAMKRWPTNEFVMSDTGLHYRSVERFLALARKRGTGIALKIFDVDPHVLAERNRLRPPEHRVPHVFLEQSIREFQNPHAWWRDTPLVRI